MATAALFDNSVGSSSSSSSVSMHESVELRSRNKNHGPTATTATDPWRQEAPGIASNGRVQLMEHPVKSGETLMQISLLYSVPVSEIKRVNNIVADHEIHAFPAIKVPLSRQFMLRRQLLEAGETQPQPFEQGTSNGTAAINLGFDGIGSSNSSRTLDKIPLLDDQDQLDLHGSNDSLNSGGSTARARLAIEGILDEADRTVAAVRQNLPSPGLEGGAFHFVDAGVPDNSSNIWLIVTIVLIVFVLLPLGLTFLEETGELEEHHQQQAQAGHQ